MQYICEIKKAELLVYILLGDCIVCVLLLIIK